MKMGLLSSASNQNVFLRTSDLVTLELGEIWDDWEVLRSTLGAFVLYGYDLVIWSANGGARV